MASKTIPLDQWLKEEHERLDAFAEHWRKENALDPEIWPAELAPGEWDEQLRAYESSPLTERGEFS